MASLPSASVGPVVTADPGEAPPACSTTVSGSSESQSQLTGSPNKRFSGACRRAAVPGRNLREKNRQKGRICRYVQRHRFCMAIKERALARTTPPGTPAGRYRPPDTTLAFLEQL